MHTNLRKQGDGERLFKQMLVHGSKAFIRKSYKERMLERAPTYRPVTKSIDKNRVLLWVYHSQILPTLQSKELIRPVNNPDTISGINGLAFRSLVILLA
jgi:hypothetical protein